MKKLIIFLSIFFFHSIQADEFIGIPKIIDGDTIYIYSIKIRLKDIDAPEMKQKCKRNKVDYFCGVESKNQLKKKIDKSKIKCISSGKDRYNRYLATCFRGNINLNKWMVKNGFAVAYRRYSKSYVADENFAKEEKLGLWRGTFVKPEKWRKLN